MLNIILAALPILGRLIPDGRADDVIAAGTKVAQEVFGTTSETEIAAKIQADPALAEQFKLRLEAETAGLQASLADVQNARAMQNHAVDAGSWTAAMPTLQSVLNWALAVGVIVCVAKGWLREDGIIVGFGIGAYTMSNSFWLGSSSGSKRSGDAVRAIAQQAPTVAEAAGRLAEVAVKTVTKR